MGRVGARSRLEGEPWPEKGRVWLGGLGFAEWERGEIGMMTDMYFGWTGSG